MAPPPCSNDENKGNVWNMYMYISHIGNVRAPRASGAVSCIGRMGKCAHAAARARHCCLCCVSRPSPQCMHIGVGSRLARAGGLWGGTGRTCCWLLGNGYADDDGGGAAACTLARQHPNNMRIRALKSTEAGSYSAEERKCACWCFSAAGLVVGCPRMVSDKGLDQQEMQSWQQGRI